MRVPIRFGVISTFVFVTVVSLAFLAYWITGRIRPNYLKLVEENLVDTSRILAAKLAEDLEASMDPAESFKEVFQRVYHESFDSRIYEVNKQSVDLELYITDREGIVLFHSGNPKAVTQDFSDWINISRTMRGEYGARATRTDPDDPKTLHLHISAPVWVDGQFSGVLTVVKPITWATIFMEDSRKEIIVAAVITGSISLVLSFLMSAWLLRPIGRLTQYARMASAGKRAYLPRLGQVKELQDMAQALQNMHKELEGKQYVEQYIQSLTHEIKSPVSAIQGAAELINEEMNPEQRDHFLSNIKSESNRINQIVDRLLELSAVEKLQHLESVETLDLVTLIQEVTERFKAALEAQNLRLKLSLPDCAKVEGDGFLLKRTFGNILQNSIDFSPDGGTVSIEVSHKGSEIVLQIRDEGAGIPEFALAKVFDRFFSLPRPNSSKKSSGLGLAFVKEIMDLHQGSVTVENLDSGGVQVVLKFHGP